MARIGAVGRGAATGVAAHGAGVLSADRAGAIERTGTIVDTRRGPSAGVQLCRIAGRLGDL